MRYLSRKMLLLYAVLFVGGCSGSMISLYETEFTHLVDNQRTGEQVKEAIYEGAIKAGWVPEEQGLSRILATYHVKIHTVKVSIYYSGGIYRISYVSSIAMKMYCSQRDKDQHKYIVTGYESCPGDRPPHFINANYKTWIDNLTAAIDNSLANIQ